MFFECGDVYTKGADFLKSWREDDVHPQLSSIITTELTAKRLAEKESFSFKKEMTQMTQGFLKNKVMCAVRMVWKAVKEIMFSHYVLFVHLLTPGSGVNDANRRIEQMREKIFRGDKK